MIRKAIFWSHLVVGTVVGLFILNMAVSGIAIAYSKQITAYAEHAQRTVAVPANTAPLDLEKLIARVQAARPQSHLSGVVIYADPAAAAVVNRDLPGLLTDSSYPFFKGMSLHSLQEASGGDLSAEDVDKTVADLQALPPH